MSFVVSPELYDGIDCRLTTNGRSRPRVIGTASSFASLTGGRIVQASTTTTIREGRSGRRMPWSYYLARPGQVESVGNLQWDGLASDWLTAQQGSPNLAAICDRLIDVVQSAPSLDGVAPFRSARTHLRWVLEPSAEARVSLSVDSGEERTVRLAGADLDPRRVAEFCAEVALHDWLLSTLLALLERSRLDRGVNDAALDVLRPAIDHLLPLWMPAARVDPSLMPYWTALEHAAGLSRQWDLQVGRIRDQLALHTIGLLSAAAAPSRA